MGGSIADLQNVLNQTIDAFNRGDMATVQKHLAADAVVKSLGSRPHEPSGVARTYTAQTAPKTAQQAVSDEFQEHSKFTPTQINFAPPSGTPNQATITGKADWTDDRGTDHIIFVFQCLFDPNRGWLFQNVSATAG